MTGRHTLYGQSLVRSAASMSNLSGGSLGKHWVKSWIKPPKKQTANNLGSAFPLPSGISSGETSTANSTPPAPSYDFEVHAWVLTDEIEDVKIDVDADEKDYLDLSQYFYESQKGGVEENTSAEKKESLSEADIRGAVGGADMIEFSNSAAKTMQNVSDSKEEIKDEEDKSGTETSITQLQPKVEESTKDLEGDVKME